MASSLLLHDGTVERTGRSPGSRPLQGSGEGNLPTRVRLPLTSAAADVREGARENSRSSLHFLLTAVLRVTISEELCFALQMVKPSVLLRLAAALVLWARIHGVRTPIEPRSEAVRWLFPEVQD